MECGKPCRIFGELCLTCETALEEAAIASALNMGVPDCWYAGCCGKRFDNIVDLRLHLESWSECSLLNP